ncbi:MAG: hypothetical protein WCM76_09830 [Bacteroidota bacterium]
MDDMIIIKYLDSLNCEERFEVLKGTWRKEIRKYLRCRIVFMPLNRLPVNTDDQLSFMVTDKSSNMTYWAVIQKKKMPEIRSRREAVRTEQDFSRWLNFL